jgi:hypothetical protein
MGSEKIDPSESPKMLICTKPREMLFASTDRPGKVVSSAARDHPDLDSGEIGCELVDYSVEGSVTASNHETTSLLLSKRRTD